MRTFARPDDSIDPAGNPPAALLPPDPVSPADGAPFPGTVRIANSVRTEPVGSIAYEFEFSTASSFDTVYRIGTASETPAETSLQIYLATGSRFFWRARAVAEPAGISSGWLAVRTFATPSGCAQFEPPIPTIRSRTSPSAFARR